MVGSAPVELLSSRSTTVTPALGQLVERARSAVSRRHVALRPLLDQHQESTPPATARAASTTAARIAARPIGPGWSATVAAADSRSCSASSMRRLAERRRGDDARLTRARPRARICSAHGALVVTGSTDLDEGRGGEDRLPLLGQQQTTDDQLATDRPLPPHQDQRQLDRIHVVGQRHLGRPRPGGACTCTGVVFGLGHQVPGHQRGRAVGPLPVLVGDLAMHRSPLDVHGRDRAVEPPRQPPGPAAQQHQHGGDERHPHQERVHEHADGEPERDRLDGVGPVRYEGEEDARS